MDSMNTDTGPVTGIERMSYNNISFLSIIVLEDHWLHDSGSTVLSATSFVNGKH